MTAPSLAAIGGLIGDPTRARMLAVLMDGRARTATELALEGGVGASTASSHLARLLDAGLLAIAKQGRHRYYRLASADVSSAIGSLVALAGPPRSRPVRLGPRDADLRRARVCYDHLAGEAGVRLLENLGRRGLITHRGDALTLTRRGDAWCNDIGIDLGAARSERRALCRPCLDWSERRIHLAGALGAALLARMVELRMARRDPAGRTVRLSPRGSAFIESPEHQ